MGLTEGPTSFELRVKIGETPSNTHTAESFLSDSRRSVSVPNRYQHHE